MQPKPEFEDPHYKGSEKLKDKVAVITGGDSGIGRAVAIAFAMEGAHVAFTYLDEDKDANEIKQIVESKERECISFSGDIGKSSFCNKVIEETLKKYKKVDVLVNNAT